MALRFQEGSDEVDKEVRHERSIPLHLSLFAMIAAVVGVGSWISGETMHSYLREMEFVGIFWAIVWWVAPIYSEYRLRSKEIYGTVTEISQAISALQQRMNAIEDELRSRRYEG